MSSDISINSYLRPCSIAIFGKFCLYCLPISDFSDLQIVKIWYMNYALHFGSAKIDKNSLYWSLFRTDINRKVIFDCLLLFKLFWLVSTYESSQ